MNGQPNHGLKGKVALVTGAGRGIGEGCAWSLARAGASVVVSDIDPAQAIAVSRNLADEGFDSTSLCFDVGRRSAWEDDVEPFLKERDGLDILVNNAGTEVPDYIEEISEADWRRILAVNLDGVLWGMQLAIRMMKPGGATGRGGAIVNIASTGSFFAIPAAGSYAATKGGVAAISRVAALECATRQLGIRVNSVHPGPIQTPMMDELLEQYTSFGLGNQPADVAGHFKALTPAGRFGTPQEVGDLVTFLASDAASFITGGQYIVDGGFTIA